jgi:hypothetical protein
MLPRLVIGWTQVRLLEDHTSTATAATINTPLMTSCQ